MITKEELLFKNKLILNFRKIQICTLKEQFQVELRTDSTQAYTKTILELEDKENILKSFVKKQQVAYTGKTIRLALD